MNGTRSQDALFDKLAGIYLGGSKDFPWYCYAALVFQVNDQMELVGETWRAVLARTQDQEELLRAARQMRESLLKASVLVGFPKVHMPLLAFLQAQTNPSQGINAMTTLRKHIQASAPEVSNRLDKDPSLRKSIQRPEKDARGKEFFSHIYAQHTERVLDHLSIVSGGDLAEFAINAVYGDLMAETTRLSAQWTALIEFLACYAVAGSSVVQAKSHMFGSHNLGNGKAELKAAIEICGAIEKDLGVRVDRSGESWAWLAKMDGW